MVNGQLRERRTLAPEVGRMLAVARRKRGWTIRECARRAGISTGMLAHLEHGERAPSVTLARALRDALDLDEASAAMLMAEALPDVGRDSPLRRRGRR